MTDIQILSKKLLLAQKIKTNPDSDLIASSTKYKASTDTAHFRKRVNTISYKDIKLTAHSIERARERLGITKKEEIKKIASQAKKNGIGWGALRDDTYNSLFGLTYEEYRYLKTTFHPLHCSARVYFYQGNVFVFAGKNKNTLKTIISLVEK